MSDDDEYIEFSSLELEAIRTGIEEELFDTKKYVLQKAPIKTLFTRKISRLNDLISIQEDLFPQDIQKDIPEIVLEAYTSTQLDKLFTAYFANKNKLKHVFLATKSLHQAIYLMEKMCVNEKEIGCLFSFLAVEESSIVSKEPDPMEIHDAIQETIGKNILTLLDVKNNVNDLPITLLNEMKRLFLLSKKY